MILQEKRFKLQKDDNSNYSELLQQQVQLQNAMQFLYESNDRKIEVY